MAGSAPTPSRCLSDLPLDELAAYARELGLTAPPDSPRGELLRVIRERQELLLELDRDVLLDIAVWGRVPVRRSEGKEALCSRISRVSSSSYDALSQRGLIALARLRNVETVAGEPRRQLEKRLQLSAREFLVSICEELGITVPVDRSSIKALIDALNQHLLDAHADGRRTILVVDEAQNLAPDVLEEVRLLTNLETAKQKLLQIILIGQPELRELLARNDLAPAGAAHYRPISPRASVPR